MEIQLDLPALRKRRLMIGTPFFHPTEGFVLSLLRLQMLLMQAGIEHQFEPVKNCSDIALARNKLTDTFLRSECTELLQLDNDVGFEPMDILAMMHFDKEVIGPNCPRKQIDWNLVREAVLLEPSIMPEKLKLMGATWMSSMLPDCKEFKLEEPFIVESIASGFSIIKRKAFERLIDLGYRPKFYVDDRRKITDFWSAGPHEERWETEDYAFCRRFREAGGKVWMCPWITVKHEGMHTFVGDMATVMKHFSNHKRIYTLQTA